MTMTIEFLRARLLSERSASKAAKQKVQQLGKKVWANLFLHSSFFFLRALDHLNTLKSDSVLYKEPLHINMTTIEDLYLSIHHKIFTKMF